MTTLQPPSTEEDCMSLKAAEQLIELNLMVRSFCQQEKFYSPHTQHEYSDCDRADMEAFIV